MFIVDDVAFVHPESGFAIGQALEKRGVQKQYYLETRCDVLVRNPEVFEYWHRLGLRYMFLGLEALDAEALRLHRKRVTPSENLKALEVARRIGLTVAVNIIADPDWDESRFAMVREWAVTVPEIVHLTVATPYPGTEIWHTESRRLTTLDYRLFDVQHAVLPTRLPLARFYEELVKTQAVLHRKHLGVTALRKTASAAAGLALRGQTNFIKMLWRFSSVYNVNRQVADHSRPIAYAMRPPAPPIAKPRARDLYIHAAAGQGGGAPRPEAPRRMAMRPGSIVLALAVAAAVPALAPSAGVADPSTPAVEQRRQSPAEASAASEYDRGVRARVVKNWPAAENAFRRAIAFRPDFADAWNELGYALRNLGRYPESLDAYGEALRLRPEFPEALEYLGEAYVKMGRLDDARRVLDRLRTLDAARARRARRGNRQSSCRGALTVASSHSVRHRAATRAGRARRWGPGHHEAAGRFEPAVAGLHLARGVR